MSDELGSVYAAISTYQLKVEQMQALANRLFTDRIEAWASELKARFPKRTIEISSGMGSCSLEISGPAWAGQFLWIIGTGAYCPSKLFHQIGEEFARLCDEHVRQSDQVYVHFTRDIRI